MSEPSVPHKSFSPSPAHASLLPAKVFWQQYGAIVNAVLFQLGWFVCILAGDLPALVFTAAYLLFHQRFLLRHRSEWVLIAVVALTGWLLDSLLAAAGVITFATSLPLPVWLMCLWLLFATTLCHGFSWLQNRLWLSAVLGAWAGASSYWAGTRLGTPSFPDLQTGLLVFAVVWALLFPLVMYLARKVP